MSVLEWLYHIVVDGLKYIIIGHYFFGYKFSEKKSKYLLLLYPLFIPIVEWLNIMQVSYLYRNLWKVLLLFILFKEKLSNKAKGFVAIWFIVSVTDIIVFVPFSIVTVFDEVNITIKFLIGCIALALWVILAWRAKRLQKWTQKFWKDLSVGEYLTLLGILLFLATLLGGIQGYLYNAITTSRREIVFMLGIIAVILFCLICVLLFYTRRSKKDLEEINLLNANYLELQRKYYEESLKQYEDMRSFRHDINHHIYVMSQLSTQDKVVELKDYIDKMAESYEAMRGVRTGNFIADCIISHAIGEKEEIFFEMDGRFPETFFMEDMDFCILLSNLFENAREALDKVEGKKLLQLEVKRYNQWFYIILRNTAEEEAIDFTHTSKKDGGYHGYGTQNIRRVVEKYGGSVQWLQCGEFVEVKMKFEIKSDIV